MDRKHLEKIEQIKKDKNQSSAFDSNPTGSALFNHLFGSINDYRYELVLDNDIPAPIFRERNLVIKVKLINMNYIDKLVFVIYKHRILNPNKKKKF